MTDHWVGTALRETSFAEPGDIVTTALEADGGVIVHDFLAADVLRALRGDLRAAAEGRHLGTVASSESLQRFWGTKTMRFTRLPERSAAFRDVLTHPGLLAVADALLLPHCTSYWMNTAQAMILVPEQPAQQLHRDADNWWRVNTPDGPELTVSCMLAIDDFTEANGATRVVPGSHRWAEFDRLPGPDDPVVQAVMPAGSALLYTGRVLHGGGENRSGARRWGLHVSFVLGWLTPEEAVPLGVPWAMVQDEPDHVQQLLGWRSTTVSAGGGRLWTIDYEDVPVGLGLTAARADALRVR